MVFIRLLSFCSAYSIFIWHTYIYYKIMKAVSFIYLSVSACTHFPPKIVSKEREGIFWVRELRVLSGVKMGSFVCLVFSSTNDTRRQKIDILGVVWLRLMVGVVNFSIDLPIFLISIRWNVTPDWFLPFFMRGFARTHKHHALTGLVVKTFRSSNGFTREETSWWNVRGGWNEKMFAPRHAVQKMPQTFTK